MVNIIINIIISYCYYMNILISETSLNTHAHDRQCNGMGGGGGGGYVELKSGIFSVSWA